MSFVPPGRRLADKLMTTTVVKTSSRQPMSWTDTIRRNYGNGQNIAMQTIKGPDGEAFIAPDVTSLKSMCFFIQNNVMSDAGLQKDKYLLQQLMQKKDGWISIKFVSGLRKVKQTAKSWRVLSLALALFHDSKAVLISPCGNKMKRANPIDLKVKTTVSNTKKEHTRIIVIKLPQRTVSQPGYLNTFLSHGNIRPSESALVLPGQQAPCDVRCYANCIPDIGMSICAVATYETEDHARQIVRIINSQGYAADGTLVPDIATRAACLASKVRRTLYSNGTYGRFPEMKKKLDALKYGSSCNTSESGACSLTDDSFSNSDKQSLTGKKSISRSNSSGIASANNRPSSRLSYFTNSSQSNSDSDKSSQCSDGKYEKPKIIKTKKVAQIQNLSAERKFVSTMVIQLRR